MLRVAEGDALGTFALRPSVGEDRGLGFSRVGGSSEFERPAPIFLEQLVTSLN